MIKTSVAYSVSCGAVETPKSPVGSLLPPMSTICLLIVIYNHIARRTMPYHRARESLVTMSVFICDLICPTVLPLIGTTREKKTDKV